MVLSLIQLASAQEYLCIDGCTKYCTPNDPCVINVNSVGGEQFIVFSPYDGSSNTWYGTSSVSKLGAPYQRDISTGTIHGQIYQVNALAFEFSDIITFEKNPGELVEGHFLFLTPRASCGSVGFTESCPLSIPGDGRTGAASATDYVITDSMGTTNVITDQVFAGNRLTVGLFRHTEINSSSALIPSLLSPTVYADSVIVDYIGSKNSLIQFEGISLSGNLNITGIILDDLNAAGLEVYGLSNL
jgi:hypothetical protein